MSELLTEKVEKIFEGIVSVINLDEAEKLLIKTGLAFSYSVGAADALNQPLNNAVNFTFKREEKKG